MTDEQDVGKMFGMEYRKGEAASNVLHGLGTLVFWSSVVGGPLLGIASAWLGFDYLMAHYPTAVTLTGYALLGFALPFAFLVLKCIFQAAITGADYDYELPSLQREYLQLSSRRENMKNRLSECFMPPEEVIQKDEAR